MNSLRYLGFDDLFLLRYMLEGHSLTSAAKILGLTQPAVTQRIRKIEKVFGCRLFNKVGRNIKLTSEGQAICNKAVAALTLMGEGSHERGELVLNVGTRPAAGVSWLWPAISNLRKKHPYYTFHSYFGSGEELLTRLVSGQLDAVLTSAPIASKSVDSVEVAEETYVFVGAPSVAKKIKKMSDIRDQILVEHDRSFPFMRYINPRDKAKLQYRDVWFLGSIVTMMQAIEKGFGIGILPEYIAQKSLTSGKLKKLGIKVRLSSDNFRLVYSNGRDLKKPVEILAEELKRVGLK